MAIESTKTWVLGKQIAVETYKICALLPKHETYALSDQMRRAAVSIPSNIAEGYGRETTKEYVKFLSYAKGSAMELKTQIQIAVDIGYFAKEQSAKLLLMCDQEVNMLSSQVVSLTNKTPEDGDICK